MARKRGEGPAKDPAEAAVLEAWTLVRTHPVFAPLARSIHLSRHQHNNPVHESAWAVASGSTLYIHPSRRASSAEWAWVIAHALTHLGMGHVGPEGTSSDPGLAAAQCVVAERFVHAIRMGSPPGGGGFPSPVPGGSEASIAARWRSGGIPPEWQARALGGRDGCAIAPLTTWSQLRQDPEALFANGLSEGATAAVDVAGGARASLSDPAKTKAPWEAALTWFVNNYPLLGALSAGLKIVADVELCRSWDIEIAAVSAQAGEIYVNPQARLSDMEWRFVLAHEMLHAALRHDARTQGRDPYLWNVSADYCINHWLVELGVGTRPEGTLFDPELAGLSSEEIYERITTDLRKVRKLITLRGRRGSGEHQGDILGRRLAGPQEGVAAGSLDEFYRGALTQGLERHRAGTRGTVPAGLVEEIEALDHPPIPWDARLAAWFEEHVPVLEPQRTWSRISRRQSATPSIPRPGRHIPEELVSQHTFGVLLDTSGSMSRKLLGTALGAIASYAEARNVPAVRLICCDASATDMGWLPVSDILGRVELRGRGGTVLQPGIDMLEAARDFPAQGPVLVITDGECDVLRIKREHAVLVPAGASLPWVPEGPVFRIEE